LDEFQDITCLDWPYDNQKVTAKGICYDINTERKDVSCTKCASYWISKN